MIDDVAVAFAQALGTKDAVALRALLDPAVDFKALTPGRFWEASSADEVVDEIVLGRWFESTDDIREILSVETDEVGARRHLSYRFAVTNEDGPHVVEQQAYLEDDGHRITWLRILCAGYQPLS